MTEWQETAEAVTELLPPGVYPIWSPYESHEAVAILMAALAKEASRFTEEQG